MKLGILTSGGDSPGMNPCIASLVTQAEARGHQAVGFLRGFGGIFAQAVLPLSFRETGGWYKLGGTVLKTGRCAELEKPDGPARAADLLKKLGIDALFVLGGDGSFRGANALSRAAPSLCCIGIPCTIDNNIYGSDYSLGFDTAVNQLTRYIDDITDTALSMENRVFLVETLGGRDGYLTKSASDMGIADFSVRFDAPLTDEEIAERIRVLLEERGKGYAIVAMCEDPGRMQRTAAYLEKRLGVKAKSNLIGYQQRGGTPTGAERLHAARFARCALDAAETGFRCHYVVYRNGGYGLLPLEEAEKGKEGALPFRRPV